MKNALIAAIVKMSEKDAQEIWAIMSQVNEDQEELCDLLAENHEMTDEALRRLRVSDEIKLAGDAYMAGLAEDK